MPRFVILQHDHPELHWDLMLESGPVLRTWRLSAPPAPGRAVHAEASFDHRPVYLDYEGPVSGDRGAVKRWDAGTFTWEHDSPERVIVRLQGQCVQGSAVLQQIEGERWALTAQAEDDKRCATTRRSPQNG
jgi:hypothetical protein